MENKVSISDVLEQNNLTAKAKLLYKLGFYKEEVNLEKLDGFKNVTFNNGFKGFDVLTKDSKLFLSKPETEGENTYSYKIIELDEVTNEQYEELVVLNKNTTKASLFNVFKISTLVFSAIAVILTLVLIITTIVAFGFLVGLFQSAELIVYISILLALISLIVKKK